MRQSKFKNNFNTNVDADPELDEILNGLQKPQKELPTKLFYDERGSILFDQICKLDEYYPTRTETTIMQENIKEMVELIGPKSLIIEYGSGSSDKTKILLDSLPDIAGYIPVDISRDHLITTSESLKSKYSGIEIIPVWADYNNYFEIPPIDKDIYYPLAYFPGSTIGNFHPNQAISFLNNVKNIVGPGGGLLIGVDLQKDPAVINLAYNDKRGVTAEFNLNILSHINREFDATFDINQFQHFAQYNIDKGRIEMYLISQENQIISIAGHDFYFRKNENILTEVSYKYTIKGFEALANHVGFMVESVWTDPKNYFSVQYLRVS